MGDRLGQVQRGLLVLVMFVVLVVLMVFVLGLRFGVVGRVEGDLDAGKGLVAHGAGDGVVLGVLGVVDRGLLGVVLGRRRGIRSMFGTTEIMESLFLGCT